MLIIRNPKAVLDKSIWSAYIICYGYIQVVPKKCKNRKNHNQNWVLWGEILPWTWLRKAWSGLVLVRNDRKINFQTQGVLATYDLASALWLQQHSESAFFVTPCMYLIYEFMHLSKSANWISTLRSDICHSWFFTKPTFWGTLHNDPAVN